MEIGGGVDRGGPTDRDTGLAERLPVLPAEVPHDGERGGQVVVDAEHHLLRVGDGDVDLAAALNIEPPPENVDDQAQAGSQVLHLVDDVVEVEVHGRPVG